MVDRMTVVRTRGEDCQECEWTVSVCEENGTVNSHTSVCTTVRYDRPRKGINLSMCIGRVVVAGAQRGS